MERKKLGGLLILISLLLLILLILFFVYNYTHPFYRPSRICENNTEILDNESEGQKKLDNLVREYKQELLVLEKENSNLSLIDKINFINNKTFFYVGKIDVPTAVRLDGCYTYFLTVRGAEWGNSYSCLRKTMSASANFTALQRCGACGEYANFNKYLLDNLDIGINKTRVVTSWSGNHSWNEIYIDGQWVQNDASVSNFPFNDTQSYKNDPNIDLFWVRVVEGEDEGNDVTHTYNPNLSFDEIKKRLCVKGLNNFLLRKQIEELCGLKND